MPTHRMHLKGPWEYEWLSPKVETAADESAIPNRVRMPAEWRSIFGERAGVVRFRRRFGRPTNLDADERVYLVFDGVGGHASIALNEQPLGLLDADRQGGEFEITGRLLDNNHLVIEVDFDPHVDDAKRGGLWGPVALEIRSGRG